MLSRSLIVLSTLTSTVVFASEGEGTARLGQPVVTSRKPHERVGTASTRSVKVRSHSDLVRANPWARSGSKVGYARIGASKPVAPTIKSSRPKQNHVQLQTTNAWAKPQIVVRTTPPVSRITPTRSRVVGDLSESKTPTKLTGKPSTHRKVASTPTGRRTLPKHKTVVITSPTSSKPKPRAVAKRQATVPPSPITTAKSTTAKIASPASANKVLPEAKATKQASPAGKLAARPEFLTDLDAMLSRGTTSAPGSSRVRAAVVSRSLPAGVRSGASRIYTAPETIFESITQATAFDSREIDTNVPTDRAAQLFASGNVPAAYHAAVPGSPMPLNRNISAFSHNPLYYEERNLERCGNGYGCATTAVSAARFAGTTLALPVLLLSEFPGDCVPGGPDCPTCTELFVD